MRLNERWFALKRGFLGSMQVLYFKRIINTLIWKLINWNKDSILDNNFSIVLIFFKNHHICDLIMIARADIYYSEWKSSSVSCLNNRKYMVLIFQKFYWMSLFLIKFWDWGRKIWSKWSVGLCVEEEWEKSENYDFIELEGSKNNFKR